MATNKHSTVSLARQIAVSRGVLGMYTGLGAALARQLPYSAVRMVVYEQLREIPLVSHNIVAAAVAGGIGGVVAQVVANPLDVAKVRMQADARTGVARYTGVVHAVRTMYISEGGARAWFQGTTPNLWRAFLVNGCDIAAYDFVKRKLVASLGLAPDGMACHIAAALVAGFVSVAASCPADVVKTRMMSGSSGGGGSAAAAAIVSKPMGAFATLAHVVRSEGVLALYKGFWLSWVRLGPWVLVFYVVMEQLRNASGVTSF